MDLEYVAAVQMNSVDGDIESNTAHIIDFVTKLKNADKKIVLAVFPEMCLYGYDRLEEISDLYTQEDILGSLEEIARVSRNCGLELVIGAPLICDKGVENSLYFISNCGKVSHLYSKTHLINSESGVFTAGKQFCVSNTALGKAGFLICWDTAFAEASRLYARADVKLIIAGAAWEKPYTHQWKTAVCGRSFDNGVPIIGANRVGKNSSNNFCGHSVITDRMGNILSEADGEQEMFITAPVSELFGLDIEFGLPLNELRKDIYGLDNLLERKD
jgi:predicted amidohydrolase